MHRIDDDARQPRRIEHALLEIELPGAVLLRHQAALQPVGEPRHHALQMRELLVEIAAQAVELLGLAQILGGDRLVELGDEGPVVRAARLVVAALARPPRLGGVLGIAHLGVVGHLGGRRVGRLGGAVGQVLGRGLGLLEAHALHVVGVRGLAVLAVLVLAALVVCSRRSSSSSSSRLRSSPMSSESSRSWTASPKSRWFSISFSSRSSSRPARSSIQRPPQIDQAPRRRRRRLAGQALAHHHRDRFLDRRIGAVGDLVELAAVELVVEHGGEILGDALHAPRADRLDARLLDRLEHRARLLAARHQAAMHGGVVAGDAQRDGVGVAAHDRGVRLASACAAARAAAPCRPTMPGRSAAKVTSSSGLRAIARRQPVTARLNGSVGASLAGVLGLMLEDMAAISLSLSRGERVG